MGYRYSDLLGSQALKNPAVRVAAVSEAVVHAAVPPLPELDLVGPDQIAAPVLGAGRTVVSRLGVELGEAPFELVPLDPAALRRDGAATRLSRGLLAK